MRKGKAAASLPLKPIGEPQDPEIVFGIVAAVGSPLDFFQSVFTEELKKRSYSVVPLRLSHFTELLDDKLHLPTSLPAERAGEAKRIDTFMNRGNEARQLSGRNDILALCAIGDIHKRRPGEKSFLPSRAFLLRQLKHPDEVYLLRRVYGDGFHLIGLYCSREDRENELRKSKGLKKREIERLIRRDEEEPARWGQHLKDTFHLSDVFLNVSQEEASFKKDLNRWLDLLFGTRIASPTFDEFGMFQAYAAALRSTQLSRQVGAAILSEQHDLVSVGTNEVPCFGGGEYWEGSSKDARDPKKGVDSNDEMKYEILEEALPVLYGKDKWDSMLPQKKEEAIQPAKDDLSHTRIMNLTEFGRAVHAEMSAILASGRSGVSVRSATLYCTTFPCHNCTKHIVDAGISRVVYIEPYPKSLAPDLHADSISVDGVKSDHVSFMPFVGVAPRRYADLFSMTTSEGQEIRRKDSRGKIIRNQKRLRLRMPHYSCLEREQRSARELSQLPTSRRGKQ